MEQFLQIRPNIIRCTYAPTDSVSDESLFIDQTMMTGTPVDACPLAVDAITFETRDIIRFLPDGKPKGHVINTVDGQRNCIENLKEVHDRQAWRAKICIDLLQDEYIFGFGQDEDGVWDKRGKITYLYQHNMNIPMPMFVSSKQYGVLFNAACLMVFDDTKDDAEITLECVDQADFFVITGTMDEIVAGYRELTGRATPMPPWAMGYWQSKEKYSTQQELLDVARKYRDLQVPLDVIVQDWQTWECDLWGDKHLDLSRYPDVAQAMEQLHQMQVHALVSVWPNMNADGRDHQEFAEQGLLLNDYSTYNAFDPEARALYWEQANRELYSGGFDGWWCDNTEPFTAPDWCGEVKLPEKKRYELVGGEHEKYLDPALANAFALVHAQGIYENQPQKPVVNLTRAGWAGIQKYGAILWAGDTSATWEELRREITKGLSISLCGIPYWTVDAGAFFVGGTACWRKWVSNPDAAPVWFWNGDYDLGVEDKGYQELYTRWLQFACFLPVFRSHGTDTPREVWNFEEPFRSAIIETIRLRYRLMPYILDMERKVREAHFTIMRSLLFDFADDPLAASIDNQFMFGTDLLVCPVTEPILYRSGSKPVANPRSVHKCYLPKGTNWYDFRTRVFYQGGQYVETPMNIERIPVYVREGSVIPVQQGKSFAKDERPVEYLDF